MKRILHMIGIALMLVPLPAAILAVAPIAAEASCTGLTASLSQGMSDVSTGGQVTLLQNYLYGIGYLSATPNGYFGPATLSAVETFQAINSISITGTVGPLTRAAIQSKSCGTGTGVTGGVSTGSGSSSSSSSGNYSGVSAGVSTGSGSSITAATSGISGVSSNVLSSTIGTAGTPPVLETYVTALNPSSGESLQIGQPYTLRWGGPATVGTYNVILEDTSGTPMGYIVANSYAGQATWNVGMVNNSNNASASIVPPGQYRIHIENAAAGAQSTDRLSGVFTISDSIHATMMYPQTIPANGTASVIIYGTNFNSQSMVDLYGYGDVPVQFVSADGTVIVFTVPKDAAPGARSITVDNVYSSSVTTQSNPLTITITAS